MRLGREWENSRAMGDRMFLFPQMTESFEVSCAMWSGRYLMLDSLSYFVFPIQPRIENNLILF